MSLPKLLLFDTGCILAVMKLNLWPQLCARFHVVVPSIIVRNEARYVNLVPGNITPIDLTQDVAAGTITEFEATPAALMQVLKDWPSASVVALHASGPGCRLRTSDARVEHAC